MSFLDNDAPLARQVEPARFRPIVSRMLTTVAIMATSIGIAIGLVHIVPHERAPVVQSLAGDGETIEHWQSSVPLTDAIITSSGAGNLTVTGDVTISGCIHFLGTSSGTTLGNSCISP